MQNIYLVLLSGIALGFAQLALATTPPNILLILTDDQGYGDVGFNGNPHVKTPKLDRLAANSVIFDRLYASPFCSPTRAALMSGRYAYRTGVLSTQAGLSLLRPSEVTIAETLQSAGYRTGLFGKWHLGDNAPTRPVDQGFERSLMHVGGMIGAPYSLLDAQSYFDTVLIDDGIEKRFDGYCVDVFTDAAIDFIHASKQDPFFIYYAPNTPHHPLTVSDHYAQPYRDAGFSEQTSRYYGMITNIDDNFGRILDALDANGQMDNTLIIFLGDNGTSSLHKQNDLWECGLRGRKSFVYENGIRVPAFIKLPNSTSKGKRHESITCVEDILPTILDICQLQTRVQLDGISLLPLLNGSKNKLPQRSHFIQVHGGTSPERYRHFAAFNDTYKLLQAVGRGGEAYSLETAKFELYDITKDPEEQHDISAKYPQVVQQLKAEYDRWFDAVGSDGFAPVKIWIGSEVQNPVHLSRQDWQHAGLFDGDLGFYDLEVKSAGTYRITCRWSELLKKTHKVVLKIGDQVFENNILYAESECHFEAIELAAGPCRFEAWVEIDGQSQGFRFIEIEKID
tara:strand:+ start:5990 stop:7687 length:1698 start_codon:yes stop_codon:yes gene_type:complete